MRIAIPVTDGVLAVHFGHCRSFALMDADTESREVKAREDLTPPDHAPGLLPRWLAEQRVNVIIAGGMGMRAQQLFKEMKIAVVTGATAETPEQIVEKFLAGDLETGPNICDH